MSRPEQDGDLSPSGVYSKGRKPAADVLYTQQSREKWENTISELQRQTDDLQQASQQLEAETCRLDQCNSATSFEISKAQMGLEAAKNEGKWLRIELDCLRNKAAPRKSMRLDTRWQQMLPVPSFLQHDLLDAKPTTAELAHWRAGGQEQPHPGLGMQAAGKLDSVPLLAPSLSQDHLDMLSVLL